MDRGVRMEEYKIVALGHSRHLKEVPDFGGIRLSCRVKCEPFPISITGDIKVDCVLEVML